MALFLDVSDVLNVPGRFAREGFDELVSVMPRADAVGIYRYPQVDAPHHVLEISDIGCDGLWPDDEVAAIMADPESSKGIFPPDAANVGALIAVGQDLIARSRGQDLKVLVHCHLGASRSPAAVLLFLAIEDGPGQEDLTLARFEAMGFDTIPNANILFIADRLLSRNGRLFGVWERVKTKVLETRRARGPVDVNGLL